MKRFLAWFFALMALCATAIFIMVMYVQLVGSQKIADEIASVSSTEFALVLGASVKTDGTPSDALRDRVWTAVDLYRAGKVQKIFMTGDDGQYNTDEVDTMKEIALGAGVTGTAIMVDGHGYRTYESCSRAVSVFHITRAVIVTQRFHLGRALYLCSRFGMDVQGVMADREPYQRILFFTFRDLIASIKAWWDVNVRTPASPVS